MATVFWDFDGVIHRYSRGWHDGTIYDDPMPGAVDALRQAMTMWACGVFTTRDPQQVVPWLASLGLPATTDDRCGTCVGVKLVGGEQGLAECAECDGTGLLTFWNTRGWLLVTQRKLPAVAYVDDRAVRFDGDWAQVMTEVQALTDR
jgi:hypothetical protein